MRKALFFFLLLSGYYTSTASCIPDYVGVWPKQDTVSQDAIFMIETYGMADDVIMNIGTRYKAFLFSGEDTIVLKVTKIIEGGYYLNQVILKPARKLILNKTYKIHINKANRYTKRALQGKKWKVVRTKSRTPNWICKPTYHSNIFAAYGCGPAKFARFCGKYNDGNGPCLVYARVKNLMSKGVKEYYLEIRNGQIYIGHGMCAGAFSFMDNTSYSVQFALLDASGNQSELLRPIRFPAPNPNNALAEFQCDCQTE